jgi:hypothetical protein
MISQNTIRSCKKWLMKQRDKRMEHTRDSFGGSSGNTKDDMLMLISVTLLLLINLRVLHTIL